MTPRRKNNPRALTLKEFLVESGPGEPLEILKARQDDDALWAERAFAGKEPLGPPVRIQRGRPKQGEKVTKTVVKAVRLPVYLLESLQAQAKTQGLSLNALLQMAASEYLHRHKGA